MTAMDEISRAFGRLEAGVESLKAQHGELKADLAKIAARMPDLDEHKHTATLVEKHEATLQKATGVALGVGMVASTISAAFTAATLGLLRKLGYIS